MDEPVECPTCSAPLGQGPDQRGPLLRCIRCGKAFVLPLPTASATEQAVAEPRTQPPGDDFQAPAEARLSAQGIGGAVILDGEWITITRSDLDALPSKALKDGSGFTVHSIDGVQLKTAGALFNGYIRFAFSHDGAYESGGRRSEGDEDTVMFTVLQQPAFLELRSAIEQARQRTKRAAAGQGTSEPRGTARDIETLAELLEKGIITETEFTDKKRRILGL